MFGSARQYLCRHTLIACIRRCSRPTQETAICKVHSVAHLRKLATCVSRERTDTRLTLVRAFDSARRMSNTPNCVAESPYLGVILLARVDREKAEGPNWGRDETRRHFRYGCDRRLDGGACSGYLEAECDPARRGVFLNRGVNWCRDFAGRRIGRT